jgi:hypothetical protein
MNANETKPLWLVVRLRRTLLGNRYRYWGSYATEVDALKEANGRNYRGVGYLDGKEKFFAYRVNLTAAQRDLLRNLSEGDQEHMVLRFSPDPRD